MICFIILLFFFILSNCKININQESFIQDDSDINLYEKEFYDSIDYISNISFSIKCLYLVNFTLYDLTPLRKIEYKDSVYDFSKEINNKTYIYNFCTNLDKTSSKDKERQVTVIENGIKRDIAGPIKTGNTWKLIQINETKFIEIELNKIPNENDKLTKYRLECNLKNKEDDTDENREIHTFVKVDVNIENDVEITTIYFKSISACPKIDFFAFGKFVETYTWLFAIILIIMGIFLSIFGRKLVGPTCFIVTCMIFVITLIIIFYQFIAPAGTADWLVFVVIGVGLILGGFVGYFVWKYQNKVLPILLGGLAGFFLGQLLYSLFGRKIPLNQVAVMCIFYVVCILTLIIISLCIHDFITIILTSFIGCYLFIRGISLFAGGLPNEIEIMELINNDETEQIKNIITWRVYVYLTAFLICFALSIFIQIKIKKDDDIKNELKEEDRFIDGSSIKDLKLNGSYYSQ